jgi:hypothetical protein
MNVNCPDIRCSYFQIANKTFYMAAKLGRVFYTASDSNQM